MLLSNIPNTEDGYNLERLAEKLLEIKEANPDKVDATLLFEPEITYDVLVQVMDKLRVSVSLVDGIVEREELFPQISVGDAVALAKPPGDAS